MGKEPPWLLRLRSLLFNDASIGWPWGAGCPATKVDEGLGVGRNDGPGTDAPLLLDIEVSGLKVTVFGPRGGSRDVDVEEEDAWFVERRGEDSVAELAMVRFRWCYTVIYYSATSSIE